MVKKIDNSIRIKILNDYIAGMTMRQVANKNNVGIATVYRVTKSKGINRSKKLTKEEVDTILELYKSGLKFEDIQRLTGKDAGCILRYVNKYAPEFRRRDISCKYSEEEINIVIEMYVDGKTPNQISKLTGIKCTTINSWTTKKGVRRTLVHGQRGARGSNYKHGKSNFPYCEKFDNGLKECVISYFDYKCVRCGKHENEQFRRLSVHHVENNPSALCDNSPKVFAALCDTCHPKYMKTCLDLYEKNLKLNEILNNEPYNGKTYYTFDEYEEKYERCPYKTYLEIAKSIKNNKKKYKV